MPYIGRDRAYQALRDAVLYDVELKDDMEIDDILQEAANYTAEKLLWDEAAYDKLIGNKTLIKILMTVGIPVLLEEKGGYTALNMAYHAPDEDEENGTQLDNMMRDVLSLVLYTYTYIYKTNISLLKGFIHRKYHEAKLREECVLTEYPEAEIDELVNNLSDFHVNAAEFMECCEKAFTGRKDKVVTLSIVVDEDADATEIHDALSSVDWIRSVCVKDEATIPITAVKTDKEEHEKSIFDSQDIVSVSL